MANILGSLQVELTANTAKFVGELGKAAVLAQQSAKGISREFSSLQSVASQTFGAFGSLNPVISQMSFAFSAMGNAASNAMREFGSTKNPFGAIASLAAGAAVGVASLEVSMIGLALKAAKSAAEMEHLAEKSGVTVEEMSGLSFAAKQVNIEQDQLSLGLARLSKNAEMAAQGSRQQVAAFAALHVSATAAGGALRPIQDILLDIADRFSQTKTSTEKTAIAMMAFGKAGYEMIPFLNLGKEGIQAFIKQAEELGIILDSRTAHGAVELEQQMNILTARFTAFEMELGREMIPTLQVLVTEFANVGRSARELDGAVPGTGFWTEALQNTILLLARLGVSINQAAQDIENLIVSFGDLATLGVSHLLMPNMWAAVQRDNDAIKSEIKSVEELSAKFERMNELEAKRPEMVTGILSFAGPKPDPKLAQFLQGLSGEQLQKLSADAMHAHQNVAAFATALMKAKSGTLTFDNAPNLGGISTKDVVGEAIGKLQAEAAAQLALAGAIDHSTAAMLFQKAASEAEQKVADLRVGLLEQEKTLEEQLTSTRAHPSTAAPGEEAKINARIAGIHKELDALDAAAPLFTALYAKIAAARASAATSGELQKKSDDFDRQITSLREAAAAYGKGPAEIASAAIDKQLEGEKEKIDDLRDEYARLQAISGIGIVAPGQGQGPSPALAELAAAIDAAEAKFEELKTKAAAYESIRIAAEIGKESAAFLGEAGAIAMVTAAYLQSEASRRTAQVGAEVAKFKTENPAASDTQVAQFAALARARSDQAFASSTAQVAAEYQVQAAYDRTREKLEAARAALVAAGESTLAIDDRIYNDELSHREELARITFDAQNSELIGLAKLYDMNRQQIQQWDEMVSKVGTFGERFRGLANEIELAGANFTSKVFDSMSKAVDDISDQLAKLVVTGQSSFKKMFEGLAEQVVKASFQSTFSNITKLITSAGHGTGQGAQGGTATTSAAGGLAGAIGKIFGVKTPGANAGPLGTANDPIYVIQKSGAASGEIGGLPLGPDFGSGRTLASILGLAKPGTAATPPFLGLNSLFGGGSNGSGSGDLGDLPFGPGFGSGLQSTNLMSLLSPESDSSAGGGGLLSLLGIGGASSGGGLLSGLSTIGKIFSSIPFLAAGGPANHGHAYVVGEKGPELFVPGISGTIIPTFSTMKPPKEGELLGNMGRAFGGFRAAGGDVMPGRAYAVGEKRPEVFMPDLAASSSSGAGSRTTNVNLGGFHVHGVQNADSFHRSESQIYANLHSMLEGAKDRG
jgi:hypothetical protein